MREFVIQLSEQTLLNILLHFSPLFLLLKRYIVLQPSRKILPQRLFQLLLPHLKNPILQLLLHLLLHIYFLLVDLLDELPKPLTLDLQHEVISNPAPAYLV